MDLTHIPVSRMAGLDVACGCGKRHTVPIRHIFTGSGALTGLEEIAGEFRDRRAFLVGDSHTLPLAGDRVLETLEAAGMKVQGYCFNSRQRYLTDESAIGEMLIHLPQDSDLIVAVGSGTMNDVTRVVGVRCCIPYVIVGTAPSMDGYASCTSAVLTGGEKISLPLGVPYGIVADPKLLVTAPDVMVSAGIGDVLGKYVTLLDWRLAAREGREDYCPDIASLIGKACRRCRDNWRAVLTRSPEAVSDMTDTLIMAGAAISMFGSSRPAAGSEHQLAHCWETREAEKGEAAGLHGNYVGLGTVAALLLYREASREFDLVPEDFLLPDPEEIAAILEAAGGYATKEALGVEKGAFRDSFLHAAHNHPRYTLLTYLMEKGRLAHYADVVTGLMYG